MISDEDFVKLAIYHYRRMKGKKYDISKVKEKYNLSDEELNKIAEECYNELVSTIKYGEEVIS